MLKFKCNFKGSFTDGKNTTENFSENNWSSSFLSNDNIVKFILLYTNFCKSN